MAIAEMTLFDRMGLPLQYAIDSMLLEKNYLERSRLIHPDYHQESSTSQQQASTAMSAELNESYSILKDPFRRADYLQRVLGGPTANQVGEMPADFLDEMLELRMEIEEIRESSAAGSTDRLRMEDQLIARRDRLVEDLQKQFADVEKPEQSEARRQEILVRIRKTLNSAKYIQGLLRDLRAD